MIDLLFNLLFDSLRCLRALHSSDQGNILTRYNTLCRALQAFLNQLKEMLLEEGAELSKEGHAKEAAIQLSEGINICAYMQKESINGHLNYLEKLLMERANLFVKSVRFFNCSSCQQDLNYYKNPERNARLSCSSQPVFVIRPMIAIYIRF